MNTTKLSKRGKKTRLYCHKTLEHVLEKRPIITLFPVDTVFWLDYLWVWERKSYIIVGYGVFTCRFFFTIGTTIIPYVYERNWQIQRVSIETFNFKSPFNIKVYGAKLTLLFNRVNIEYACNVFIGLKVSELSSKCIFLNII